MQTAATGRADPLLGRSLEGRYRILERIARGGMSTVYAAVDERLDRLVAVKVMSAALSADPNFSDRFAREARAAARLTHLNVVSVYDQGQDRAPDGHHVFLVMELVEGRTLRELLRERGRLTAAEAVSVMEPVLGALSAAHRAGLVHRDIKPENILLSDDGVVKVADFGLARAVEADAESTRTGLMMGTVAYCAPEQISRGVADPRSDVYSAGVVLFELLTGHPPYRGDSAMNVAYQHVHSRVPAPSSKVRGLPEELDELVVAATDSDPGGRPADAGAFLAEIADLRSALSLPVTPVPPRERPRPRTPRAEQREGRRTPDAATTDQIRRGMSGRHDTSVVPGTRPNGARPTERRNGAPREENVPPPPVVIPPPKTRSLKSRRRRRALVIVLVILLLGGLATGAGLWAAGVFSSVVPKLVGKSPAQARTALHDAGCTHVQFAPGPVNSETIPKGDVVDVDPAPGTTCSALFAADKTVTMTLSAGPKMYQIPSVRGRSTDSARQALLGIGSVTVARQVRTESSLSVPQDQVTRTVPAAGTMVNGRQTITIYVSTGPPLRTVPGIQAGTSVDDATSTLTDAKFDPNFDQQQYDDTVPAGAVISCSPDGGQVPQGTVIKCIVSKGPQYVNVPDISIGTPVKQALQALKDAGLVGDVVGSGNRTSGAVIAINPGAGKQVQIGSTVTVFAVGG